MAFCFGNILDHPMIKPQKWKKKMDIICFVKHSNMEKEEVLYTVAN